MILSTTLLLFLSGLRQNPQVSITCRFLARSFLSSPFPPAPECIALWCRVVLRGVFPCRGMLTA
jgi:hypothetical protein